MEQWSSQVDPRWTVRKYEAIAFLISIGSAALIPIDDASGIGPVRRKVCEGRTGPFFELLGGKILEELATGRRLKLNGSEYGFPSDAELARVQLSFLL